ncbi:MAG: hypothetical protein WAV54_17065 [Acidimicrobiales bacterium]
MQPRFEQVFFAGGSALEASRVRLSRARLTRAQDTRARLARANISCAEVALVLPSILDGGASADEVVVEHVGACLRCQSELARYRKLLRLLNQLRAYRVEPPPGAVADVLGALEEAAHRHLIRSVLAGRRLVYVGAFAVPAAAIIAVTVAHRGRLRRVRPVVLS